LNEFKIGGVGGETVHRGGEGGQPNSARTEWGAEKRVKARGPRNKKRSKPPGRGGLGETYIITLGCLEVGSCMHS